MADWTIEDGVAEDDPRIVVHDAFTDDPAYAFALSRLSSIDTRYSAMGVFRSVERPVYDVQMAAQVEEATTKAETSGQGTDDAALQKLLLGADTWTISA